MIRSFTVAAASAKCDELRTKVSSDHGYVAAAKKARNLFVPGSERDQVWMHE